MKKFDNAYDAGYDAGMNGANTENSNFKWFATNGSLKEWQKGNNDGSRMREIKGVFLMKRKSKSTNKTNQ